MTQRALADRLGVDESVVSRDERNDYHGITVSRATKALAAMDSVPVILPWARYKELQRTARE